MRKRLVLIGVVLVLLVVSIVVGRASRPSMIYVSIGDAGIISGEEVGYGVYARQDTCGRWGFHPKTVKMKVEGKEKSLKAAELKVGAICEIMQKKFPATEIVTSLWYVEGRKK